MSHRSVGVLFAVTASLVLFSSAAFRPAYGQAPPVNGMRPSEPSAHVITNARIIVEPGRVIEKGSVLIRRGVITEVGESIEAPAEARIWDAEGLTIYPGFIEPALLVDVDDLAPAPGRHWSALIRPERMMSESKPLPDATRAPLRGLGFTAAAVYPSRGILRGSGMVVALGSDDAINRIYAPRSAMAMGLDRDSGYPGSLMGSIAHLRQALADAQWHGACAQIWESAPGAHAAPMPSTAWPAMEAVLARRQVILFDAADELNAIRAAAVMSEFGNLRGAILGSGGEYRRLDEIAALGLPFIVPLNFPSEPNVSTIHVADNVSLRDLASWEQGPTNARRLREAGVTIALTTHRLRGKNDFWPAVRDAVKHGLSRDDALAALTTVPADLLGLGDLMGKVAPGMAANLVVVEGDLFESGSKVRDVWVDGKRHEINRAEKKSAPMEGTLALADGRSLTLRLDAAKSKASLKVGDEKPVSAKKVTVEGEQVSITIAGSVFQSDGWVRLSGVLSGNQLIGTGDLADGSSFPILVRLHDVAPEDENDSEDDGRTKEAGEEGGGAAKDAKGTTAANDPVSGSWTVTISMNGNPLPFPMSMDLVLQPDGTVTGEASMMDQTFPVQNARFDRQTKKLSMEAMGPGGQGQQIEVTIGDNAFEAAMSRDDMSIALTGTREAPAAKTQGDSGAGGGRRGGGKPEAKEEEFEMPPASLAMPFGEYGFTAPPEQETVLLTNATIWTSGPRGIIRGGAMLVRGGKIEGLYDSAPPVTGVTVIDVEGRHITPGLIDCHSHTAISGGVNEGGQTNTGECRIRDVVNPDDINIYRQLAGGLTAMNQLHGSANPIGGQNCVVKLKWGASAEEMIVDNYKPGIKFALGENVTRGGSRYPGSRMGVETFIRDAFTAGREWSQRRAEYAALGREEQARSMPVRRDLELEAMAEIVAGNRIIHCHSYRQDEILMLMRVCESFAVRIGTFQHVLEGFKVADAIAAHGAGASSFADWWAYKVEVMDAIPHNGSLMTQIGVNVSFNSDDSELARRMNTEAAKAVRYGGLEPAEALKLVTINPATQIGIGHRTGSLEPGKDADFVVWSGDPLSTYSRAEQTWIEGRRYFDRLRDAQMRAAVESERHRIIQKLLRKSQGKAPASQAPPESADGPKLTAEARHRMEEMVRYGFDPLEPRCGECGDEHDHFRP